MMNDYPIFKVIRVSKNELFTLEFSFIFVDFYFILDEYSVKSRENKEDALKLKDIYSRTNTKINTVTEEEIRIPDDIKTEVITKFSNKLKVVKEKEFFKKIKK